MSSKFKNNLDNVLGVDPDNVMDVSTAEKDEETNVIEYVPKSVYEDDKRLDEDFEYSRNSIKDVLDSARKAVVAYAELSTRVETPHALEVLGTLLKDFSEVHKDLLELHSRKNELKNLDEKTTPETVHNNTFITSAGLLEIVKNANK